ncbi:DUF2993 domain-containing protein [Pleurocapsales cyanobacterium LEGE 06147]|nr:DUF2993 domain-containing protein [Pleurocapsales cyanobacterium LEGE 06147]
MKDEPNLAEKALDRVTEAVIASQLDGVKNIDIDIRIDPLKLFQGQVDSITVEGEGMEINEDIRVEGLKFDTDSVAINLLNLFAGQIDLTQPINAQTQIVLTEEDLNRALSSDYFRSRMKNLKLQAPGRDPLTIDVQNAAIELQQNNRIGLDLSVLVRETNEIKKLNALSLPLLKDNGDRIQLEILSSQGQGLSLEFLIALFESLIKLLDFLQNLKLDGITLSLRELQVQEDQLLLKAVTKVVKVPTQ